MVSGRSLKMPLNRKVNGLRDAGHNSDVKVFDAKTGELKRIEPADGKRIKTGRNSERYDRNG